MLVPHGTRSRLLFLLLDLLGLLVRFIHLNFFSSQALGSDSQKKPTIRRSNDVPNCGFVGDLTFMVSEYALATTLKLCQYGLPTPLLLVKLPYCALSMVSSSSHFLLD